MIQRIQTIFLFLAAALNLPVLFLKLADASSNATMESPSIHLYGMKIVKEGLVEMTGQWQQTVLGPGDNTMLLVHMLLVIISTAIFLTAIFLFNNRPLQTKVTYGGLVLVMVQVLIAAKLFMDLPAMIQAPEGDPHNLGIALALPAASILMALLAARRIQKDDKMVRSMDRIR